MKPRLAVLAFLGSVALATIMGCSSNRVESDASSQEASRESRLLLTASQKTSIEGLAATDAGIAHLLDAGYAAVARVKNTDGEPQPRILFRHCSGSACGLYGNALPDKPDVLLHEIKSGSNQFETGIYDLSYPSTFQASSVTYEIFCKVKETGLQLPAGHSGISRRQINNFATITAVSPFRTLTKVDGGTTIECRDRVQPKF